MALGLTASGEKQKVRVDPNVCNGCGVCKQMCKFDAMYEIEGENNANL
jgi:indolepyruvate ferredoxin oxidoreductase alpha subunit